VLDLPRRPGGRYHDRRHRRRWRTGARIFDRYRGLRAGTIPTTLRSPLRLHRAPTRSS